VRDGGPAASRAVAELESLAAAEPALLDVSARLHALARRPA
jgi:S-adenosylmethionine-dependent methyltransferase